MATKGLAIDYQKHFQRDPKILGGQLVIKGTRIHVRTILASLVEGADVKDILVDFPTLEADDIKAVIAFASASALKDLPTSGLPTQKLHQE